MITLSLWLATIAVCLHLGFGATVVVHGRDQPRNASAVITGRARSIRGRHRYVPDDVPRRAFTRPAYAFVRHGVNFFPFIAVGPLLLISRRARLPGDRADRSKTARAPVRRE